MTTLATRFRFARDSFTLDVDLEFPGGVTGILGPSGAGKTTFLRLIAGLERAPNSAVRLGERVWEQRSPSIFVSTHDRGIGFVFQEPSLFSHLNVRRNLQYGWKRTSAQARTTSWDQAIDLLDLSPLLDRAPSTLSGGEGQRVAIARALLTGPRLLCLDEPLANIDPEQRHDVLTYLERVPAEIDVPVVYVSHNREEVVRLVDYLVVMRDGTVEAKGPLDEVLVNLASPLARARDAGVVLTGSIVAHDDAYALTTLDIGGAELVVSRIDQPIGDHARVRVAARDVSITLERPASTSILNVLSGEIAELAEAQGEQVVVRIGVGHTSLLSRITRKSADRLALAPGANVFAQIKGVAVVR